MPFSQLPSRDTHALGEKRFGMCTTSQEELITLERLSGRRGQKEEIRSYYAFSKGSSRRNTNMNLTSEAVQLH